jgi:hypothetical protein
MAGVNGEVFFMNPTNRHLISRISPVTQYDKDDVQRYFALQQCLAKTAEHTKTQ